jgi:hypothetical protein
MSWGLVSKADGSQNFKSVNGLTTSLAVLKKGYIREMFEMGEYSVECAGQIQKFLKQIKVVRWVLVLK